MRFEGKVAVDSVLALAELSAKLICYTFQSASRIRPGSKTAVNVAGM